MYKIIKKSTFDSVNRAVIELSTALETKNKEIAGLISELKELKDNEQMLLAKIDEHEKLIETQQDNYVKIIVSPDLKSITPVIGYRSDCFENLFQDGMLDDTKEGSKFAIQLALMTIANEALQQLIESFEPDTEDA